jgi:hypothetical protein
MKFTPIHFTQLKASGLATFSLCIPATNKHKFATLPIKCGHHTAFALQVNPRITAKLHAFQLDPHRSLTLQGLL